MEIFFDKHTTKWLLFWLEYLNLLLIFYSYLLQSSVLFFFFENAVIFFLFVKWPLVDSLHFVILISAFPVNEFVCDASWLYSIHSVLVDWKLTILLFFSFLLFFEHVESNQSNMRDHKKPSQQEQPFFLQSSSLFLRASVSSLLNKESMIWPPNRMNANLCFSSLINAFVADN